MYVERHGSGARAYLGLHGWGSDRSVFAPLAAHVPHDASLQVADLPGCGSSPRPSAWTVEAIVKEVVDTVRGLDADRITIVGHCGGAIFALFAALVDSERVERIVAIDPFAYLPRYFRLFAGEGFGRRAYDATFANPLGRWVTNRTLQAGRSGRADMTASFSSTDHEVARRYLSLFDSIGGVEPFREVRAEVDLVYGEKTFGAVKKSIALFGDVLPCSRSLRLEGAGHMPIREATAQLARIIFEPKKTIERDRTSVAEEGRVRV